jgi:hypothetical protein
LKTLVPLLRKDLRLDAVIANAENSAENGLRTTVEVALDLFSAVDFLTLGDHAFDGGKSESPNPNTCRIRQIYSEHWVSNSRPKTRMPRRPRIGPRSIFELLLSESLMCQFQLNRFIF